MRQKNDLKRGCEEVKFMCIKEANGESIGQPGNVAKIMEEEGKMDRESMWVLHLNTRNQVIEKELVSLGSVNASVVHPREVFKRAILNSATAIITVHNHPSGNAEPSAEDKQVWKQLNEAGKIIEIKVLDNIIITPQGGYYSEGEGLRG